LVLVVLAAACEKEPEAPATPPVPVPPTAVEKPHVPPPPGKATAAPPVVKREMPHFPPLTEEKAVRVLRGQFDRLAGDDVSRQALLYLADLGDRTAVEQIRTKLLAAPGGKFDDLPAAAIGAEALVAFGEPDAAATVLKVAKQYTENEQDPDEFLVHALARIDGPDRAAANAALVAIADGEDDQISPLAVEVLAKNAAKEARESFLRIAKNEEAEARTRASAIAGLLRIGDPAGAELAQKLVAEATKPESPAEKPAADAAAPPQPEDVAAGFGVEGAVETVPYVQKIVDATLAEEAAGTVWVAEEATLSLVRIHAKSGGAAVIPWLKALGEKSEGEYEDYAAYALWALGDEASAPIVAKSLESSVAAWSTPSDMGPAIDLLDIAARLGTAAKSPLRPMVDSAAQIDPASGEKGLSASIIGLNLAAAHAFLKSGGK
jgi:hypothetical protein